MSSPLYNTILKFLSHQVLSIVLLPEELLALTRFSSSNDIADLPESAVLKIHNSIKGGGGRGELEFNRDLTRFYVAVNLKHYADRLETRFHSRSWKAWITEQRSMSEDTLTFAYNQVGIELSDRPTFTQETPVNDPERHTVHALTIPSAQKLDKMRSERLHALIDAIRDDENVSRIEALSDTVKLCFAGGAVSVDFFFKEHVVRIFVQRGSVSNKYRVEANGVAESHQTANSALKDALTELKAFHQENLNNMAVKKAPAKKAGKAKPAKGQPGPYAMALLREMKNTEWDWQENFGQWQKTNVGGCVAVEFYDESMRGVNYTLKVEEDTSPPYVLVPSDRGLCKMGKRFTTVKSALTFILNMLISEAGGDDVVDDEDENENEFINVSKKPALKDGRKAAVATKADDTDEYTKTAFIGKHALARCQGLEEFLNVRESLLADANDDIDNVSSMYHELETIATHSFTRVVAEYWPLSFAFEVADEEDEESPEYVISCNDFSLLLDNDGIEIREHHGVRGMISYKREMISSTLPDRLDAALRYFDTWGTTRIQQTLERVGFDYMPSTLRSDNSTVDVLDTPDLPGNFFEQSDELVLQVSVTSSEQYSLIEFLRDETGTVRGVVFVEGPNSASYSMDLFGKITLHMITVSGRGMGGVILVANSASAHEFFKSIENDEEFTIDDLNNRGMIVSKAMERYTLDFNHDGTHYTVHIYN